MYGPTFRKSTVQQLMRETQYSKHGKLAVQPLKKGAWLMWSAATAVSVSTSNKTFDSVALSVKDEVFEGLQGSNKQKHAPQLA